MLLSFKNATVFYIKAGDYLEVANYDARWWCIVNRINHTIWPFDHGYHLDVTILHEECIGSTNPCGYILDEGVIPREATIWPSMWKLLNIKRL